jgi:hypothetical protein
VKTLGNELRELIAQRIAKASPREIFAITSTLCNESDSPGIDVNPRIAINARFSKLGDEMVGDSATGLVWAQKSLGEMNWAKAKDACANLRVGGHSDWRLPTIRELLTLVDYERHDPCIDTDFFECKSTYYWTSTPAHSNPADSAWIVYFGNGGALWDDQDNGYRVRAVRASQGNSDFWNVR